VEKPGANKNFTNRKRPCKEPPRRGQEYPSRDYLQGKVRETRRARWGRAQASGNSFAGKVGGYGGLRVLRGGRKLPRRRTATGEKKNNLKEKSRGRVITINCRRSLRRRDRLLKVETILKMR